MEKTQYNTGTWNEQEEAQFWQIIDFVGKDWDQLERNIPTRSKTQINTFMEKKKEKYRSIRDGTHARIP